MQTLLTTSNILFALGILGTIFGVYHYFKNPQVEEEKKTGLLSQQVQWEKESNSTRFTDMNTALTAATTLAQNHIHTIDVKVDKAIEQISLMRSDIVRLGTIIEERMPKKTQ